MQPRTAGYSGKPLSEKLGVGEGDVIATIDAPTHYAELLRPLPDGARITTRVPKSPSLVHVFATSRARLRRHLELLRGTIAPNGTIWVSWPKRTSKMQSDITEDVIREVALPLGLVDIKVCAVDDLWSGLKLVIRRELR
jgi:hypothetical protein